MAVRDDAEPPETRRVSRDEPDVPLILSVVAISPDGRGRVNSGLATSVGVPPGPLVLKFHSVVSVLLPVAVMRKSLRLLVCDTAPIPHGK